MCTCTARDAQKALSKKQKISGNGKKQREKTEEKQRKEKERKEKKEGKKKTGVQGGAPLCAADTNFPKERIKRLAMKGKTRVISTHTNCQ